MCEKHQNYKNYQTFILAMKYNNDQKNYESIIKLIQSSKDIYKAADILEEKTLSEIPLKDNGFYYDMLYFHLKTINYDEIIEDFKEDERVKQYFKER